MNKDMSLNYTETNDLVDYWMAFRKKKETFSEFLDEHGLEIVMYEQDPLLKEGYAEEIKIKQEIVNDMKNELKNGDSRTIQ